ncbi:MAG: lamin tail domain-containing protein [Candidatus Promineifilaceae bacterium]|nr:lamin tail domain-containing protein [Candidatus Promineifilaceae bacterium]
MKWKKNRVGNQVVKRLCYLSGSLLVPILMLWVCGTWLNSVYASDHNIGASSVVQNGSILIDAVLYDGLELFDADEAVALRNLGDVPANISGWRISDDLGKVTEPLPDMVIEPGALIWVAGDADAFGKQFGFAPDLVLASWPGFANAGDEVILFDSNNQVADALVYENGMLSTTDWQGPAVQPYTVNSVFGQEGQVLFRKRDPLTGLPVADSDVANNWAQEIDDPINGRKVQYPGWNLDEFFLTAKVTETAVLTISIAPDNALETMVEAIEHARETIISESFTFENIVIADAMTAAANRGVDVKILLEGSPPGGLTDHEKFVCQQLENAGGQCWFMISDADLRIYDRYRYLHGKFMLIDNRLVAISSENLSPNSMPFDDKSDGTWGRRGVVLWTDAKSIVSQVARLFEDDFDPAHHHDIFRWRADHHVYGPPPSGFVPISESGGVSYSVQYPSPAVFSGQFLFDLDLAPENSLHDNDSLLKLIEKAGEGDSIWVEQLVERPHWGPSSSNRTEDPNPRLEAYIAAARRGAEVRLLLDAYFDDPNSLVNNHSTCVFLKQLASEESLKMSCRTGNPTGLGIHNKMILAHVGGKGYLHVGSINGSELSHKGNREVALLVQADAAYSFLADMFERDWPHVLNLPLIFDMYQGPANHVLISEILYDSFGADEGEFIELVNPTAGTIDLSGYGLADAVNREDFEDLRRFPPGTSIAAGELLVVATSGEYFWEEYGSWPDFEILDTTAIVPDLIDDPAWGDQGTFLRLGNGGDEVILRDSSDLVIDLVTYGESELLNQEACPLLIGTNHSLERYPYWLDSDNCPEDFRDWPFPNPGVKP